MLFIVTFEQQFFDIGKANCNLDLAIFYVWPEEMLDTVHKSADVIIYKLFRTGSVFPILNYTIMFPALSCSTHSLPNVFWFCPV